MKKYRVTCYQNAEQYTVVVEAIKLAKWLASLYIRFIAREKDVEEIEEV